MKKVRIKYRHPSWNEARFAILIVYEDDLEQSIAQLEADGYTVLDVEK